jgi:alpha-amylase
MSFWEPFQAAAGIYCLGEVLEGDPRYVFPYQEALDGVLGYPAYYQAVDAFNSTNSSMLPLANSMTYIKSLFQDTTLLGSFSENGDVSRWASITEDMALAKNVLAFTIMNDGIPIVFYGQEQHMLGVSDPDNRGALWLEGYNTTSPLYRHIASLNQIRNTALFLDQNYLTYKNFPAYVDAHTLVMRKGWAGLQTVTVLSNLGEQGASYELDLTLLQTGFGLLQKVVEIVGCTQQSTDVLGTLHVQMAAGLPKVC